MNHVRTPLMVRIYEASAKSSIEREEFGEFLATANKLIWECAYKRSRERDWVFFSVLLLYGSMDSTWSDFSKLFYKLEMDESLLAVLDLLVCVRSGNGYQLERAIREHFDHLPDKVCCYIRQETAERLDKIYRDAFRPPLSRVVMERLQNKGYH